ncbi:hypothetical protein [Myxococcus phage Mx4 ts27htf-1hrm-1]|nr:hypothetical protein Mx4_p46 [Myxococcus phage Mx4]WNM70385.1 hypothetical protein [Myxococcus phage Mx4 ts27htf-1hrm-1]
MARRPSPNNGPASATPARFAEAVEYFRARLAVTDEAWRAMSEEARQRAFKVAGVAQLDLVASVWKALDKAVAEGTTFADFKREVGAALKKEWGGSVRNPGARLETIYRTNVQTAYSRGTWAQIQDEDTRAVRPFIKSVPILGDGRTSVICATIGTVILPADHPWWLTHWAPLHFNCRRTQTGLTRRAAEKQGVTQVPPAVAAAPGFGRAPGLGGEWQPDVSDAPDALRTVYEAKAQAPIPPVGQPILPPLGNVRGDSAALVEQEVPRLASLLGDRLRVDGALTSEHVRNAVVDLAKLPDRLLSRIREATTDIHLADATLPNMGRSGEAGKAMRKHRANNGDDWEVAGGLFFNQGGVREVLVSRNPTGCVSTAIHEVGHAVDTFAGDSTSPAFRRAWESFRTSSAREARDDYFTRTDVGHLETFAEAFALFWANGGGEYGASLVTADFGPGIAAYLVEHYGAAVWEGSTP